jgi:hypothetical protein
VRLAKGEYFAWLNSDDTLLPGAIRRTVAALEGAPPCGAVYGDGFLIDREGAVIERFPYTQPFDLQKLIYVSDYILQQSVLFRKSAFEEAGYLDEDLHYAMDWDILIRIGKRRPLLYLPEDIGCLRVYPETKTSSGGAPRVAEIRRVMQRHTGLRWAPGYVTYGLETYRELWCEWIQSRTPAGLQAVSTLLQRTIRAAANTVIGHQHVNWQSRIPEASRG